MVRGRATEPVGRAEDVRAVTELLQNSRLVSITGPGGMGKTTLAESISADQQGDLVDLSMTSDAEALPELLVHALGIVDQSTRSPVEQLVRGLGARPRLLVLDNCEHLIGAVAALVDQLLSSCPELRILTTSIEPLALPQEHIHDLQPLGLPGLTDPLATVLAADSVVLFRTRARQVAPNFEITEDNRAAVAEICHRLDGLPLALELGAARMRVLSAQQLRERLDQRFAVLNRGSAGRPARHRTLRALVEWSHERCSEQERVLWARLSVFRGPFDLDAAEQVCGFGELEAETVLDLLDGLVSRSVLSVDRGSQTVHYRQLASIRDYGVERLAERGEVHTCRERLLHRCLAVSRRLVDTWCGPEQAQALATWRREHGTIQSVLGWALADESRHDEAADLLCLLRFHWIAGGQLAVGRRWLDRVLDSSALSPGRRGHTLSVAAWVSLIQGETEPAADYLAEADAIARRTGDPLLRARVLAWTALGHLFQGRAPEAIDCYRRSIPVLREGEPGLAMTATFQLAMAQTYADQDHEALRTCAEQLAASRRTGDRWNRAYALWVQGLAHWHLGELAEAEEAGRQALEIQQDFQDGICIALTLLLLAWIAAARGDLDRAREQSGAADAVWRMIGTSVQAFGPDIAREHQAHAVPGGATGADQITTRLDAVRVGLRTSEPIEPLRRAGLSNRELEAFALLAAGRSNREIAQTLVISQRTAEGHVARILQKLGLTSRAEVAAWYAQTVARTRTPDR